MAGEEYHNLEEIFELENIAVVGCSRDSDKAAHRIPRYLQEKGYNILPVNPFAESILGRNCYNRLLDVEEKVDIVDVFRPSKEAPEIVEEAIERGDVKVVWMQLGISNQEASEKAEKAGITVVQDKCMKVEHSRMKR